MLLEGSSQHHVNLQDHLSQLLGETSLDEKHEPSKKFTNVITNSL